MIYKIKAVKNFQSTEFEIDTELYCEEDLIDFVDKAAFYTERLSTLLDTTPSNQSKTNNKKENVNEKPASEKQLKFIKALGGSTKHVKTYSDANKLIRELKENQIDEYDED